MAKLTKNRKPKGKVIRANLSGVLTENDSLDLFSGVKSVEKKCKINNLPGKPAGRRTKGSEYLTLMRSKQAMKHYYGLLEKPFKRVYSKATQKSGSTADNMLSLLESRLDNVVYRSGFAVTRAEAKQLISHGHILLNGKRVTVPSIQTTVNDQVALSEKAKSHMRVVDAFELSKSRDACNWLETEDFVSTVHDLPNLDALKNIFKVNLVIELYSK